MTRKCFFDETDALHLNDSAVKMQEILIGFLLALSRVDFDYELPEDWNNMYWVVVSTIATASDCGTTAWNRTTLGIGSENVME